MKNEIEESIHDNTSVTVIEWADVVSGVLPNDRIVINIETISEDTRRIELIANGSNSKRILEQVQ